MTVFFVYRSHCEGPTGKYVRRFDDASVLDWFRNRWRIAPQGDSFEAARAALGTHVYGFNSLFSAIGQYNLPPPGSNAALGDCLDEHLYVEGKFIHKPDVLQVLTDDDELELAYYFFDDAFLEKCADRAAFLLHEGVDLPRQYGESGHRPAAVTRSVEPGGTGEGAVYMAFLAYYDSLNLTDLKGGYRIDGVRLPRLGEHLATGEPTPGWPLELKLLRSRLDVDEGDRGLERALGACARFPVAMIANSVVTSTLGLGGLREAAEEFDALGADARFAYSAHDPGEVARAGRSSHRPTLPPHRPVGRAGLYHRWILFDDLWAEAQPDLAEAILRYAGRWDVLS